MVLQVLFIILQRAVMHVLISAHGRLRRRRRFSILQDEWLTVSAHSDIATLRTVCDLKEDFEITATFTDCDHSSTHAHRAHLDWQCVMLSCVSTSPSVDDHTSTRITPNINGSPNHAQQPIDCVQDCYIGDIRL